MGKWKRAARRGKAEAPAPRSTSSTQQQRERLDTGRAFPTRSYVPALHPADITLEWVQCTRTYCGDEASVLQPVITCAETPVEVGPPTPAPSASARAVEDGEIAGDNGDGYDGDGDGEDGDSSVGAIAGVIALALVLLVGAGLALHVARKRSNNLACCSGVRTDNNDNGNDGHRL